MPLMRTLGLGHTDWVRAVSLSADGTMALSGAEDGTVRLWDTRSGGCKQVLEGHTDWVRAVSLSADGTMALSGAEDGTVRLWDTRSGECKQVLEGHTGAVFSVSLSADGTMALSGVEDGTVRLWDTRSGECKQVLEGHPGAVFGVSLSADGTMALSGAEDGTVRLWDTRSGECKQVLEGHTGTVFGVSLSADGTMALSGVEDGTVRLWDTRSGECKQVLEGHTGAVFSVSLSADGTMALSGADDDTVRLWDTRSGECKQVLEGHTGAVFGVSFSADGTMALSGAEDGTVRLWDTRSGECKQVLEGHTGAVFSVSLSADGTMALSGANDRTVRLWDTRSGECKQVLEGHTGTVFSVSLSADGTMALSGADDDTVRLWDTRSGECKQVLEGHTGTVFSVSLSADSTMALSGVEDGTVRLWDTRSGECKQVLEGHTDWLRAVSLSADGTMALSGADDDTVRLWDTRSGECKQVLEGHTGTVFSVSLSADGTMALSGVEDGTVRLWDTRSGECKQVLEGHTGAVFSVSLSADGTMALSGASDRTVRLWDTRSGECKQVLEGHTGAVLSAGFLPGAIIWSAAQNGVLRLWDLSDPKTETSLEERISYTNAKILFVGESGAGKTGLSSTLAHRTFSPSESSTVGAWATHMPLTVEPTEETEREVWLWDFGGQADQRLVHQLYIENSAVVVLVFNADQRDPIPGLRDWKRALDQSIKTDPIYFLVAARTDAGRQFDRASLHRYAEENGYRFFETSARLGENMDLFRQELLEGIEWHKIPHGSTPLAFRRIKEAILRLRDENVALLSFDALKDLLRSRVPSQVDLEKNLSAVLGLLDSPGIVKLLDFGRYVLLRPEWINKYAQAVLRTIRADDRNLGCIEADRIRRGDLIFSTPSSETATADRLSTQEETVVLRAMEDALLDRGLCIRQDDRLVFPSHCGIERPTYPHQPLVNVSYRFEGYLDDLYATLITRLAYSGAFKLHSLWRDAADFTDRTGKAKLGVRLNREASGAGVIELYRDKGITRIQEVIFAEFVHHHLEKQRIEVERRRHYICPHCDTPVLHFDIVMELLSEQKLKATIPCVRCRKDISLWDEMEDLFAGEKLRAEVFKLEENIRVELDSRRKGALLVYETLARITEANQKGEEVPAVVDEGIDIRVEFTAPEINEKGNTVAAGTARHLLIQAKSGNSHIRSRKRDGAEIFLLQPNWVRYWAKQNCPVMLVIGTLPESGPRHEKGERFKEVLWMEVGAFCRQEIKEGRMPTQVEFKGEPLTTANILKWRELVLQEDSPWRAELP